MINEKKVFGKEYPYFLTRVKKAKTILHELTQFAGLETTKKLKVLAVGGEYGLIEYNLSKWTQWDLLTSDFDESLITKYPQLKKYIKMQVLDTTKLPFKAGIFDLVIFNHVIEHIPDYTKAISELNRVLKKNGILYIATPNLRRKLGHPRVVLTSKKNLSLEKRMARHIGFSKEELEALLSIFETVRNITKAHQVHNLKVAGLIATLFPESVFKYAQTNVFICQK